MASVQSYRDLIVWQKSMRLAKEVYRFSRKLPKEETYGLRSQLTRAAVSIPTNIAEGQARHGTGEFFQFLGIARGSLAELETLVILCRDLCDLSEDDAASLSANCAEIGRLLSALVASLRRKHPPNTRSNNH